MERGLVPAAAADHRDLVGHGRFDARPPPVYDRIAHMRKQVADGACAFGQRTEIQLGPFRVAVHPGAPAAADQHGAVRALLER
ncbi:hypothetical protein D3C78_1524420 [compost metagenome]